MSHSQIIILGGQSMQECGESLQQHGAFIAQLEEKGGLSPAEQAASDFAETVAAKFENSSYADAPGTICEDTTTLGNLVAAAQ